jgi:hypothetical protein
MPKRSQGFTPTKNMGRDFILCPTLPTHNGLSISPIKWRCLLRILCPVRNEVVFVTEVMVVGGRVGDAGCGDVGEDDYACWQLS